MTKLKIKKKTIIGKVIFSILSNNNKSEKYEESLYVKRNEEQCITSNETPTHDNDNEKKQNHRND